MAGLVAVQMRGLDELRRTLSTFSDRRFNAVIATALTRTAMAARDAVREEMPRRFDRPSPYTLNSLFVRPARADRLVAQVGVKDEIGTTRSGTPATRFLLPNVEGGGRRLKRFERVLEAVGVLPPGMMTVQAAGARLDAYGNMARGQITQVLSQLRAQTTAGYMRNLAPGRKGIASQRRAGGRYFVMPPGRRAAAGVYQREFVGRNITPVLLFVKPPTYPARFDFDGIAGAVAQRELGRQVQRAVGEHIARTMGFRVTR